MELSTLSTVSNGNLIGHSLDIENFSLDSRNIKQGDLYIALQGTNFDGHDFVEEAISKGASSAVVHKSIRSDIPHILVNDTYDFMKSVALFNRSNFEGKVIGITGTNGKTSTKQILSNLLDNNNQLISKISARKGSQLINNNIIRGGMTPKLIAALEAKKNGVKSCHIIDGRLPHAVLLEVLTAEGVGTMIS